MAWRIHFQEDRSDDCVAVEHVVRVDEAAHVLVYPESTGNLPRAAYVRGASFELRENGESLQLIVLGWVRTARGLAIRAGLDNVGEEDPATMPAALVVHQRRRSESLMIFMDRLSAPRQFLEIGERDSAADLEKSIPVGACVLSFAGETAGATSARAIAAIMAGSNTAMGQSRALKDEKWRLLSFNRLDDAAPDHVLSLDDQADWRLDVGDPASGSAECVILLTANIEAQWEAFAALFTSASATVEVAIGVKVPTLPMSVAWAGQSFFAAEISVFFRSQGYEAANERQTNVEVRMKLVRDPRSAHAHADLGSHKGPLILLGRVQGKPAPEDGVRLLEVIPAAPADAEGRELAALADWRSSDDLPLQVVQPVPGYARKDRSAFYARWTAGDLILVQVAPGAIPVGLGAPRRYVAEFEQDGAAELVLRGKGILQRAEGETSSSLLLQPNGDATVIAPNSLGLTEAVSITPDLVAIKRKTHVTGELDVD